MKNMFDHAGALFAFRRSGSGLSIEEVSQIAGVSAESWIKFEETGRGIDLNLLAKTVTVLRIEKSDLYCLKNPTEVVTSLWSASLAYVVREARGEVEASTIAEAVGIHYKSILRWESVTANPKPSAKFLSYLLHLELKPLTLLHEALFEPVESVTGINKLSKAILELCAKVPISRWEFAELIGADYEAVTAWIWGRGRPRKEIRRTLATFLRISEEELDLMIPPPVIDVFGKQQWQVDLIRARMSLGYNRDQVPGLTAEQVLSFESGILGSKNLVNLSQYCKALGIKPDQILSEATGIALDTSNFADTLYLRRLIAGLKVEEAASIAGFGYTLWSSFENGAKLPTGASKGLQIKGISRTLKLRVCALNLLIKNSPIAEDPFAKWLKEAILSTGFVSISAFAASCQDLTSSYLFDICSGRARPSREKALQIAKLINVADEVILQKLSLASNKIKRMP